MTSGRPDRVSAEVWPHPGKARSAAAALQDLGFRVLHIGETVSVDAPAPLWAQVFKSTSTSGETSIPEALHEWVREISLVKPPDLHR